MELQFIGAAKTVTGSLHYFKVNGKKFILDCGLVQGKRKESFELNRTFEFFDPEEIDYVILSHAHIDHAGNLPNLVKKGFRGNIYATLATRDLCSVMLLDSAHIQEKDVEYVNKKRKKQSKNLFEPLYTQQDVHETMKLFVGLNYHHTYKIDDNISVTFYDAGHILGSAVVYLTIQENGRSFTLGFSGDLGRPNLPILRDPEKIPDVDFFICESTYGGRFHQTFDKSEENLTEVLKKAIQRKAKIIVPSFSVGRTQELVYVLNQIFEKGLVPPIPIFVDSPLSVNTTAIFKLHPECFDEETISFMNKHRDPFGFEKLKYITDVEDSKKLNDIDGPVMIISASGMAEAGRIQHHLANNIGNANNIILIIGYCAEHTLGKRIVERQPEVKIFGEIFPLNAEVIVLNSFSAHADANELIDYCSKFDKEKMKNFFIVHGDEDQQIKFRDRLLAAGFGTVTIPSRGDVFSL